ncbi:MAG: recombinase family protein [Bryobacteraceae bacterium]|nr:recombinase family protein [Bryobacteraceae bacterium]
MAVAVYLRVSTEEQRERQSIATQREFGGRYTELHGIAVYRVYADDGVSGTVPLDRRPEGSQILRDAKLGKFDQLLVYKLDRLGRDTRLILNGVAELEKYGVRVRSMTEEFDTGTATGRLMLTMLSGFASHEREVIRERSLAGTDRVAEAGVWLGGIVPFGYRKAGDKGSAKLVVSEEPIPGMDMSEADVIRLIYQMAAVEKKSCRAISDHLNRLGVPCAYTRDGRAVLRGKRKQRTSGVWRPGRVRNLVISKTYMGRHEYGKRSPSKNRKLIVRAVSAIVDEGTWKKAQQTLRGNILFSRRSAKKQYLLRGLIKCGMCGLTYIGTASSKSEYYYRCNGAHSPQIYGPRGRCQSKAVRGDHLEEQVWSDVETFLRNPQPVLEQLHARLEADAQGSSQTKKQVARLEGLLAQKETERSRVVGLYRRGRLTDAELDAQMDEIGKEEAALEAQIAELRGKIAGADSIGATISSAQALLEKLRKRLDEPVSWELKRRLIEVLVAGVHVDTVEECGVKQTRTTVTYRFSEPDHPMPLVLPQSCSPARVIRIPTQPQTVGDHLRRRRLSLKVLQRDVAERLGVTESSIWNWEAGQSEPDLRYMAAVIEFLGYNPLPEGKTLAEKLVRYRTSLGMSQKEAAQEIGVDPGTLAKWERGERHPTGEFLRRVMQFLAGEARCSATRRAG